MSFDKNDIGVLRLKAELRRFRDALERIRDIGRTARGYDELEECVTIAKEALAFDNWIVMASPEASVNESSAGDEQ